MISTILGTIALILGELLIGLAIALCMCFAYTSFTVFRICRDADEPIFKNLDLQIGFGWFLEGTILIVVFVFLLVTYAGW